MIIHDYVFTGRGSSVDWKEMPMPRDQSGRTVADVAAFTDDEPPRAPAHHAHARARDDSHNRVYSDILIAHSTVPGELTTGPNHFNGARTRVNRPVEVPTYYRIVHKNLRYTAMTITNS